MVLSERIKRVFGIDYPGAYFNNYVQRTNAILARNVGIAVACIELLLFINIMLQKGRYDSPTNQINRAHAISYLLLGLASVGLAWVSNYATTHNQMRLVIGAVIVYTILSVIYGIVNSVLDARQGEPPLAFLICLMATTCVFIMPPIGSLLLNSVAFIVFNQVSSFSSMYEPNTVFHYWVGWIVVSFVSILRYHECRYGSAREEKIYDASELDELTGLRNRRSLRKDFSKLHGQEFFVAMCDLDDFKHVNDTYGHVEGDFVLRAFSEAIIAMFADDHCYRYGGDEFLVISGCKTQAEFRQRVATMRSMFNTYLRSHGTLPVFPTTSVGYTYGYVSSENELRAMVHVADSNLYKVKQSQKGGLNGEKFKTSSGE